MMMYIRTLREQKSSSGEVHTDTACVHSNRVLKIRLKGGSQTPKGRRGQGREHTASHRQDATQREGAHGRTACGATFETPGNQTVVRFRSPAGPAGPSKAVQYKREM